MQRLATKPRALAFALLAYAGAAQAQADTSSIKLYGFIDASVRYQHANAGNTVSAVDGSEAGWAGSRWGLIGKEDLGGGLKAIFNVENGFALDTGAARQGGRLFGRTAYVGLSSKAGDLTLGRQYNALYYTGSYLADPTYVSSWSPSVVHQLGYAWDNAIAYTGTFADLIVRATFAPGEQPGSSNGNRQAASLLYNGHPLGVAVGYGRVTGSGQSTWNVGGYYEIGPVTAQLTHYRTRNEPDTGAKRIVTNGAGLIWVPVPAWEFTGAWWRTDTDDVIQNKFLLVARYSFSARTKAYVEADTARDRATGRVTGAQIGLQHTF